MSTNPTDAAAPPKCFHLNLDIVPENVRAHVDGLIEKINLTLRSAEVITWIDGLMGSLGIHHTGTIPASFGEGAWCTVMVKDGKELSALRRAMVAADWHLFERSDYPDDHRFVLAHKRGDQVINLNCYIGGNGARCQYVKVGEKTVPVMELRCDGAEVTP